MDYNTLKEIVFNMPESYTDLAEINSPLCDKIKMDIIFDKLVEKGIFRDWNDVLINCSEKYEKYRQDTFDLLRKMEEEYEHKNI